MRRISRMKLSSVVSDVAEDELRGCAAASCVAAAVVDAVEFDGGAVWGLDSAAGLSAGGDCAGEVLAAGVSGVTGASTLCGFAAATSEEGGAVAAALGSVAGLGFCSGLVFC